MGLLCPRIKMLSRAYLGSMSDCVTSIHADTTMPNSSSTLTKRAIQSLTVMRSRARTWASISKRHHTPNPDLGPKP